MSRILDFSDGFTSATEPTTGDLNVTGDVVITGDLTVGGTTVTLNTQTLDVEDLNITINKGGNDASAEGAGITVDRTSTDGSLVYDSTKTSKWKLGNAGSEVEVVNVSGSQTLTNKTLTSPAITTPTGIVKGDVGLGNVDNTSDATKNSASATLTNKTLTSPVLTAPSFDILTATEQGSTPSSPSAGTRKIYVKDDGKAYLLNSSGTETALGSGGAGGINYLSSNPDAETSTSGWATYADAAASSPVDGTGGSPSSTYTRSTSSPLRGTASFLWTKSAANRQGEGFSYAFTIDASDKAKVLQISFDYLVSSGTYANSDMTIWVYDVTNATLIQPAGYTIQNATVSMKQLATFQSASNSTSYRLIVHTASTSASAYTLQFDNFAVGPQIVTNGAAVTDWTSFTPTGSLSTNVTYTGKRRRVGDQEEFRIKLDFSGANTQGALTVNLPVTIDTTKIPATVNGASVFGIGAVRDFGSADFDVITVYNSTTSVAVLLKNSSATYAYYAQVNTASNIPMTVAASDAIELSFSVPVVGYSSNVQLSSDTDTRVVAARVKHSANQTGVNPNNSAVKVNFNSTTATSCFDTHGAYDTSAFRYNVAVPGKYQVAGLVAIADTNVLNNRYIVLIYKNGAEVLRGDEKTQAAATYLSLPFAGSIDAVSGDYIEVYLYGVGNNSASTLTITTVSHLNISRLSGPAVVAASESIVVTYVDNAGAAYAATGVSDALTFNTKEKDSHNAFNGTTGIFTAPVSANYSVSVTNAAYASVGAAATYFDLSMATSGTGVGVSLRNYPGTSGSALCSQSFTKNVKLLAEETLTFTKSATYASGTVTRFNSTAWNSISITRIGNY